jgi:hypothetical protein
MTKELTRTTPAILRWTNFHGVCWGRNDRDSHADAEDEAPDGKRRDRAASDGDNHAEDLDDGADKHAHAATPAVRAVRADGRADNVPAGW